jgi:peptide/nickel transport system substrate-binding protein
MTPLPRHFYQWNGKFSSERFNNDHKRNRMIVSCGPYVFSQWSTERRILLERNKRYFGNSLGVGAKLEYLVFDIIKHPNTRFQALLSGNLDRLGLTPDQWMKRSQEEAFKKNFNRYKYLLPQFTYIGYNQNNPIFKDKRTRQALTMLVDREKIKKDIYHNLAEIVTGPFFPQSSYYNNRIKPLPYNPAKAKELLAAAGWRDSNNDGILDKDGLKFEFTMLQIPNHPIQQKMMPIIKESFAACGIDMKLQNVEWSVYIQRLENRSYDACSLGWSSSFDPDMYQIWHSSQSKSGGSNHINYSNKELDKLIIQMRETFDKKKRETIAHKIGEILHEDQPYTFLFCPYSLTAISKRYNNVKLYPIGIPELPFYVNKEAQLKVPGI